MKANIKKLKNNIDYVYASAGYHILTKDREKIRHKKRENMCLYLYLETNNCWCFQYLIKIDASLVFLAAQRTDYIKVLRAGMGKKQLNAIFNKYDTYNIIIYRFFEMIIINIYKPTMGSISEWLNFFDSRS